MAYGGGRTPALAGVRAVAHQPGIFHQRHCRQQHVHAPGLYGTLSAAGNFISVPHTARDRARSGVSRGRRRALAGANHDDLGVCMEPVWFVLVAVMIIAYVVLDGFDLGAGVLHLLIDRSEEERRTVIRTIGPVWDGNEVWLIAGGGTLYFAFPLLYASSFSGFYLPLNIVLWLLVLRGIGIEFRMHIENQVWKSLFDGFFAISSALLAIFFGAALGNVVRGVPL